jgi:anti-anti-sigma regulatory factor
MKLDERLAGVRRLSTPVWIFDTARCRIPWANQAAIELWRASSPEELAQRDFSDMSEATRTQHEGILAAFREGRTVVQEWTWYPGGTPVTLRCAMSPIELDDGRIAELCEASVQEAADPERLRGVEALRHTSVMVALVTSSGEVLMQNPAARRAFGASAAIGSWLPGEGAAAALLGEVAEGRVYQAELLVDTCAGQRWHAVEARPTLDPATGERAVMIQQLDVTARRESEALIEQQRQEILSLSAPILEVGRGVLAVPIIGTLDRTRSAAIAEKLLASVAAQQAEAVILDLTGAAAVCEEELRSLVRALRLLGARPIVTGVQPSLAREMVSADPTHQSMLEGVVHLRNLRQGIASCVAQQRRP